MSTAAVTIRYDGPVLSNHQMDIADIAPALMAISELCKIANGKFNGDRSAVKVLIGTDAEHRCFQLKLQVVQTVWEHAKTLLADENVKSAKELLEWIGLAGPPASLAIFGFFPLLKKLKGRKIATVTKLEERDGRNLVRVHIEGDHNTVVLAHPQAVDLIRDESAVRNAKAVVEPLLKHGYDRMDFEADHRVFETFETEDAVALTELNAAEVESSTVDEPQTMTVWITVYSPVYDVKAPKWRFQFGEAREYVDISETDIAASAIRRGGAMKDDAYRVQLEITQEHKPAGGITNHYKVKKVLEFRPARLPHQSDAFDSKE